MKSRTRRSRITFLFSSLFATSVLFAQPPDDTAASAFLDFGRFSTIAPADQLGFLDRLKWAGMIFVNAPAAKRIVSLYDYTRQDITDNQCSSNRMQDHHALLVTSLVPTDAAIEAISSRPDYDSSVQNRALLELEERAWITEAALVNLLPDISDSNNVPKSEPVWYELSFSNSCELQRIIENLDYDDFTWRLVDDPKLRSIIQTGLDEAGQAASIQERIIITEPLFPASSRQYFAECEPSNQPRLAQLQLARNSTTNSICDTAP